MSARPVADARATLDALLRALLEGGDELEQPQPRAVGVCLDQVVQLAGRLDQELSEWA